MRRVSDPAKMDTQARVELHGLCGAVIPANLGQTRNGRKFRAKEPKK